MEDEKNGLLTRREFTSASVMAMLAGVAVTVTGCSSGGNGNPNGPSNPGGGDGAIVGAISDNHSHTATINSAQVNAGNAFTLDIRGQADHPHTVQITMAELTQIAAGTQVSKTSSQDSSITTGPHSHIVTFN